MEFYEAYPKLFNFLESEIKIKSARLKYKTIPSEINISIDPKNK